MAALSDLTAQCIRCGFCLESCPTFVISGNEAESPRGRIYLARSIDEGVMPWSLETRSPIDTCVGCRACETACPSGVQYGEILELARAELDETLPQHHVRTLLRLMTSPTLLRLQLWLGQLLPERRLPNVFARWLSVEPQEFELPPLPDASEPPRLDPRRLPAVRGEVALLEGCVMGVVYPEVQRATERLIRRVGFSVRWVKGCCGALHAHAGQLADATRRRNLIAAKAQGCLVVTNSAGCGSWLREAGSTVIAQDATEFLFEQGLVGILEESISERDQPEIVATYHDACHLAHGQKVREQPRRLLAAVPGLQIVPLHESDMCCGSGGVYNLLQPTRARKLLDRKWSNIDSTKARIVVTGNPGCQAWIGQAARESGGNVQVLHTMSVLDAAFSNSIE